MNISTQDRRTAYSHWLRTGRWPVPRSSDGIEVKFNPYHDPWNGRFTFAPGGRATAALDRQTAAQSTRTSDETSVGQILRGNILSPPAANQARPPSRPAPTAGRGSNSRAFEDPMTLEQSFPGLHGSPAGAVIAAADNLLDLSGPANAMTMDVLQHHARQLVSQIKALDPNWHYDEIVPIDAFGNAIETVQGVGARVNNLRFQRAALIARARADYRPLQVETVRFVQQRADRAYDRGVILLKAGRLTPRLSDEEALGNYIDREVRRDLRDRFSRSGIDSAGAGPVRVNRRENISRDGDLTYRRPDARVSDTALDVTLTRKTSGTAQIRGFFDADFRPTRVIIIRPRQLGNDHNYVITRPETKR